MSCQVILDLGLFSESVLGDLDQGPKSSFFKHGMDFYQESHIVDIAVVTQ